MGTNFYIRCTEPKKDHLRMHIAKRSFGWKIHFQDSDEGWTNADDGPQPEHPEFHSVAEIRKLLKSKKWQLEDEYGDTWAPGQESVDMLSELLKWNGGTQFTKPAVVKQPNTEYDNPPDTPYDHGGYPGEYRDKDGYAFTSRWFR